MRFNETAPKANLCFLYSADSCKGATVEYFDDDACSSFIGISELEAYEAQCLPSAFAHDHPVFQALHCSRAPQPAAPALQKYSPLPPPPLGARAKSSARCAN